MHDYTGGSVTPALSTQAYLHFKRSAGASIRLHIRHVADLGHAGVFDNGLKQRVHHEQERIGR